jgi:nitrite reductase (NADH) small subunit
VTEDAPAGEVAVRVGRLDDIPEGGAITVTAGGRRIAVFRTGTRISALDGACPHAGGPIGEGMVRDGTVTCPWHWWRFSLDTGERVGAPAIRLRRYEVEVRDGEVWVRVPPPQPALPLRERLLAAGREWQARHHAIDTGGSP